MSTQITKTNPQTRHDLGSFMAAWADGVRYGFNCHMLGKIVSFDAAAQTASIQIVFRRQLPDRVVDYPVLVNCPVFVYSGGGGFTSMPVAAGDSCLVLFHDRDIDTWWSTGGINVPPSARAHDLNDGLALIGFRSQANTVGDYSTTYIESRHLGSSVKVGADIRETAAGGSSLVLDANADMKGNGGAEVKLHTKIVAKNGSTDLHTLLTQIADALASLNAAKTGSDVTASITPVYTAINNLLATS